MQASNRNLEGTNLSVSNSFAMLDDDNIYNRALEMGVDPSSFSLEKIDNMKALEIASHSIDSKKVEEVEEHQHDKEKSISWAGGRKKLMWDILLWWCQKVLEKD